MTVLQLKKFISKLPDDMEVILQKDAEGNGYSPLEGCDDECVYIPDSTWSGEVYSVHENPEDVGIEESEWYKLIKRKSLVLFPLN